MIRSVLNFTFSGGSTDDLMASTNALRIVCEKIFADCGWTIDANVSRHGSALTVTVDGSTFDNVRALPEQYLTHLRTTTFKYAEPSFQYDGVDINTAIRSKPSEHDPGCVCVDCNNIFEGRVADAYKKHQKTTTPLHDHIPISRLTPQQLEVYHYFFGEEATRQAISDIDDHTATLSDLSAKLAENQEG